MVNFMCQLDWAEGCPDIWKNTISGWFVRTFPEYWRLALDSVDWVKMMTLRWSRAGGQNPIHWGPNRTKRWKKGKSPLSSWAEVSIFSCFWFLGLWTLRLKPVAPWAIGLQPETRSYTISSSGSQAFGLKPNYTTGFPGSPACRGPSLWGFLASTTTQVNCYNKSPWNSLVAKSVKNLPAMQETRVWFLGEKYPLEKEAATHSTILARRIPWTEKPDRLQPMGSQESDTTQRLNHHIHIYVNHLETYVCCHACLVSQSCPTLGDPVDCSTPGFPVHHQLPELAQTPVHRVGDTIQPSRPLLFSFCLQFFPASGSFPESQFLRIYWPKGWNFSFSISPSNEYSGPISFRSDWFDLLAVQGLSRV